MARKDTSPAPSTDSRVDKIRKTYDRRKQQWAHIHEEVDADYKCLSMDGPWPDKERKMRESPGNERPCLHEDVITQFNNMTTNQLEMNPMGIDVQPEGDGANEHTAEWVEGRIRQVEYEQNGQHAYLTAGKCAVECSVGFWELETDSVNPFSWDKQVLIRSIQDPKSVLVDLNCRKPDWSDISDAFKISRMSHDEFKQKFPQAEVRDFEGFIGKEGFKDWVDSKEVQVAAFWEVTKKPGTLLLVDDGTDEGWSMFELNGELFDVRDGTGADVDADKPLPFLKRKGKTVEIVGNGMEEIGYPEGRRFPIIKDSKRFVPKVTKCLTNGIEILEETEWEDCEIPIFVVTGRVKFENGLKVIDSQTRKGRIGQLLYDLCITAIQEETAMIAKIMYRGYEGQFDTSTNHARINREPGAYAEYLGKTEGTGDAILPIPEIVDREPKIQALLELKQSLLIGIQNALGISSAERKDKASKSGKALQELQDDMNVGTYHFHNSLRMAQLRQYRAINRLLPKVENTAREVGIRNVKGDYKVDNIAADHYQQLGRHEVVIGSAKYYQSLQEEQSDFAESLLKSIGDPTIMLAVLPDLIRMKGLGPYGDDLAKMVEAMQPPQMQQARQQDQGGQMSPAMIQMMSQQAQQTVAALNANIKQKEGQIAELLFEKKAETLKYSKQMEIEQLKAKTSVEGHLIDASVKEQIENIGREVAIFKQVADVLVERFGLDHEATQNDLQRQHEQDLQAQSAAAAQQQQESQQAADAQAQPVGAGA